MNDITMIIILVVLLLLALLVVPQFMTRRAVKAVLRIFREHNAVGIKNAKSAEELGLQPKGMAERMMRPRDYKPRALQALMSADIVRMTEDGKIYLAEENLTGTNLDKS